MPASTTVNASGSPERSETARCRVVAAAPDEPGRRPLELREQRRARDRDLAERLGVRLRDRPFERGRVQVRIEHARVGVVEHGRLDAPAEQRVGLAHEELVECVVARDEHRQAATATPGAAPLLP